MQHVEPPLPGRGDPHPRGKGAHPQLAAGTGPRTLFFAELKIHLCCWVLFPALTGLLSDALGSAQEHHLTTLTLSAPLCGGGGDGGSTGAESRSCYLEMYAGKKNDKVDPREEALARWTRCRLSNEPLNEPCVCDELGRMYNKEAVIQALLTKSMPKELGYISLKTLIDLKLTPNDAEGAQAPFCCPVTGQEMSGRFRFLVCRSTGHVFSDKAVKTVPAVVEETIGAAHARVWPSAPSTSFDPVSMPQAARLAKSSGSLCCPRGMSWRP